MAVEESRRCSVADAAIARRAAVRLRIRDMLLIEPATSVVLFVPKPFLGS